MRKLVVIALLLLTPVSSQAQRLSDAEIRQQMIKESIASYSGNCPCPYNRASNGSSCGKRSAYSRPGGASPLCYPDDISQKMIDAYRHAHDPAK
jgi:hypothetical protein